MSFQITGLNELVTELAAEATQAVARARGVVQASAARVKATAKQLVPVDSGELRDSITYETRLHQGGAEGEIGPTARHGVFVEWGTSKMAPQAFMGPALDRHGADFEKGMAGVPQL